MSGNKSEKSYLNFLFYYLGILLCWFPSFLGLYPGLFTYDSTGQLEMVKYHEITTHHPVIHTLFLGGLANLSQNLFGGVNKGVMVYTVIQMFIMAFCFAYVLDFVCKAGIKKWLIFVFLLWFGFFPPNVVLVMSCTKDSLFSAFLVLFVVKCIELFDGGEEYINNTKKMFFWTVSAFLTIAFRNNALYAIILFLPIVFIMNRKYVKKIILFVLLIFILILAMFLNENREYLTSDNITAYIKTEILGANKGSGYPAVINGTNIEKNNAKMMGKYLSYISDTSFYSLTDDAGEIVSLQHSYTSPALSCVATSSVMYETGGYNFSVVHINGKSYSSETKGKIYCADMGYSGVYAIASETNGYFCEINVFNKKDELIYSYKMSEYYAIALSVDERGKYCAVAGMSSLNGQLVSAVYILDFTDKKPYAVHEFSDNMIFDIEYMDDDNIACIGDRKTFIVNMDNDECSEYDYSSKTVLNSCINNNYGIALCLSRSGDGNENEIVMLDKNASVSASINISKSVKSIAFYNKTLTVLTKGNLSVYNKNGELINTVDCGKDAKSVIMKNENTVYLLCVSKIECVNI